MKLITPDEIEARWMRFEKRTVTWLAASEFSLAAGALAVALLAVACWKFSFLWTLFFRPAGHIDIYRFTSGFFPFLIVIGLLPLFTGRLQWPVYALMTAVIWSAGLVNRRFDFADSQFLYASMPLMMTAACGLWFARQKGLGKRAALAIWLAVFLAIVYMVAAWPATSPMAGAGTKVFWRLLPQYFFFLVFSHLIADEASKDTQHLFITPAHLVFPLVFPVGTEPAPPGWNQESRELWWDGFIRLSRGLLIAAPLIWLDNMFIRSGWFAWPDIFWRHLFLLLATVVVGNVGVGLAQMFGIKAPPGTLFVFLARSPIDFWKRDSTYAYHFALRFIFFPAARLFKNAAAALMVSFGVFYIYRQVFVEHFVKGFHEFFFPGLDHQIISTSFPGDYWMWLGWFAMIVIGAKFWFTPQFVRRSAGHAWIPVIATHVAMMLPQLVFHFY